MSRPVIKIENVSKIYRLGELGTGTISHDLNRWWKMNVRGQEDPFAKVGSVNDRTQKATKGELVAALSDINLEINQGDIVGIIGKNGAGKSTLLKLLSRVTSPTTGSIRVRGRMASLLEVGTGFHPEMTGRENIYMNGTIMGMRRHEITSKLDEIVEFAGVAKYIDTPTKRYSSGMTVRLGFAIAAHLEPEILVVDEVLAVGDAEFQKKAIGKMQDISQGHGRTVLFVSHNMGSIRTLCNSGIILHDGSISGQGTIDHIVDLYVKGNTNINGRYTEWSNNVSKEISLKSLELHVQNKQDNESLDINDCISLQIKYDVNEEIRGAHISVGLYKEGLLLFRTWDCDSNPEKLKSRKIGSYLTKLDIPNILLPGVYSISVSVSQAGLRRIDVKDDAIIFELENILVDASKKSFSRGGLIKTNIIWQ